MNNEKEEEKRQKLRMIKEFIPNAILRMKIQQMVKQWKKRTGKSRHRVNILKEWAETEKSYIKDLTTIINKI